MPNGVPSKKKTLMRKMVDVEESSGNVFADLGLPDAEELLAKARIVYRICEILEERNLTQEQAAKTLGVDQPKISALMRGRLSGFSTDRLFRFLNALDRDIEIVIKKKPRSRRQARVRVLAA
jgi:predicted XRE-type DNA-binding protein